MAEDDLPTRGNRDAARAPRRKEARALLCDPDITVEEVASRLNVSPTTLYRHLPGGRGALRGTLPGGKG